MRIKHLIIPTVITAVVGTVTVIAVDELRKKAIASLTEGPAYQVTGPLVSVVIPALEEQDYLPLLLTSIQNQTYQPIEVIVADSSPPESHELTQEVCAKYTAKCIYVSELGVAQARNEGARQARGDILLFSDADNILAPDCVETLVAALQEGYTVANPVETVYDDGIIAFGAVWGRNWLKPANKTTRCIALWSDAFWEIGGYDQTYDPMKGYREDLKLGQDIIARFGEGSIKLVRDALIASSARREKAQGIAMWKSRGVRNGVIIEY